MKYYGNRLIVIPETMCEFRLLKTIPGSMYFHCINGFLFILPQDKLDIIEAIIEKNLNRNHDNCDIRCIDCERLEHVFDKFPELRKELNNCSSPIDL